MRQLIKQCTPTPGVTLSVEQPVQTVIPPSPETAKPLPEPPAVIVPSNPPPVSPVSSVAPVGPPEITPDIQNLLMERARFLPRQNAQDKTDTVQFVSPTAFQFSLSPDALKPERNLYIRGY